MPHPALRPVDAFPIENEGETYFVLRDTEGVAEAPVLLSPAAFFVATLLDGKRETPQIQEDFSKQFQGAKVQPEEVEQVVQELDRRLLLRSPAYEKALQRIRKEFHSAETRKPYHAGGSYASESPKLLDQIDGYYADPKGAGAPQPRKESTLSAILAPHIDFPRGGPCYTHAYRRLSESCDADLFVILGVAHSSPPTPFVLTRKHYETPFGLLETETGLVDQLSRNGGSRFLEHEITHRTEHSAEFQAVFLRHTFPKRDIRILPILCSSFEDRTVDGSSARIAEVEDFLQSLREILRKDGRKVCLVGGVDLAHVGPRFGDGFAVTPKVIRSVEEEDRKSLDAIEAGDAEGFWESVMKDGNRRRVCGVSAIYSVLRLLDAPRGRLLQYGYAPDPAGGIVSFASVEFMK